MVLGGWAGGRVVARGLCGLGVVDDAKGNNLPGKEGDPLVPVLSFVSPHCDCAV